MELETGQKRGAFVKRLFQPVERCVFFSESGVRSSHRFRCFFGGWTFQVRHKPLARSGLSSCIPEISRGSSTNIRR